METKDQRELENDDDPPALIDVYNQEVKESLMKTTEKDIDAEKAKISRKSDSRMSFKKKKNRDYMRKTEERDSYLSDDSKRKSKSIEVFDFYVNSIDDDDDRS